MSLSYFPLSSRSLLSLCSYKVFLHGKFISLFYIYIRWHSYSWSPASHFGFVALSLLIISWLWWRIQCDQYMSVKPLLPPSVRIYWTNPLYMVLILLIIGPWLFNSCWSLRIFSSSSFIYQMSNSNIFLYDNKEIIIYRIISECMGLYVKSRCHLFFNYFLSDNKEIIIYRIISECMGFLVKSRYLQHKERMITSHIISWVVRNPLYSSANCNEIVYCNIGGASMKFYRILNCIWIL